MNREITEHFIASFAEHISSEYQSQTWVRLRERNKDVYVCVPYMTENSSVMILSQMFPQSYLK